MGAAPTEVDIGHSRSSTTGGVVAGNPGSLPWTYFAAAGLARAGLLRRFVLPFSDRIDGLPRSLRGAPGPLGPRVAAELAKRALPPEIPSEAVVHESSAAEALVVACQRIPTLSVASGPAIRFRNVAFDHALRKHVRRGDLAVLATFGAAQETLRRAAELDVVPVLDWPIAHYSFAERLLAEEARLRPDYAESLQFQRIPPAQRSRFDEELRLAERVIVLSSFQARTFVEEGVAPEKLVQIPLGVDLELFRPQRSRRDDGVFRVVFVGQIGQRKGIAYLVDAVKRAGIANLELLLVGRPIGRNAPWQGLPEVRHVPHVPRRRLPEIYAAADAYVLPSLVEGFPLTALEAMACGLPVIVSEHTFGRDVVTDGDDGYVVPIRDADAIAERLRILHRDPELRTRLGRAARSRAEEFSWTRFGDGIASAVAACR